MEALRLLDDLEQSISSRTLHMVMFDTAEIEIVEQHLRDFVKKLNKKYKGKK